MSDLITRNAGRAGGSVAPAVPALLAALALAMVLHSPAHAQSRAFGAASEPADLRAALGACPSDLLRDAWSSIAALQAAAVESEVLALCTERAENIALAARTQIRLNAAVQILSRPPTAMPVPASPETDPAMASDRVETLRTEIGDLKSRIARLESEPERPETAAALDALYADVARAEVALELAEPSRDMISNPPVASVFTTPATATSPTAAPRPADTPTRTATAPELMPPDTGSRPVPGMSPTPAPASLEAELRPGATMASEAEAFSPPDGSTDWQVVFVARRNDGPWRVQLQPSRRIALPVPAEDSTTMRWQTVVDPPLTLTLGDHLPGGWELRAVTPDGVTLAHATEGTLILPVTARGRAAPGDLAFTVIELKEEDE